MSPQFKIPYEKYTWLWMQRAPGRLQPGRERAAPTTQQRRRAYPVRQYSAQIKIQICTNTKHKTQTQNTNTKNIMHILWDNTLLSQIKIQNRRYENILLDNALLIDQDTNKYKYKYLFKEAQITNYPQCICKRSWKFPFPSSWFVSWPPFRCATTVNAQFVVIFEDCSHHMDPVQMKSV